jgi:hypothetical protein
VLNTVALLPAAAVAEHVRQFLNPNLVTHLTKENASKWLRLISRCHLREEAKICINTIISKQLQLEPGLVTSLWPDDADYLLRALQLTLAHAQDTLEKWEPLVAETTTKTKLAMQVDKVCPSCKRRTVFPRPGYRYKCCLECGCCEVGP